MFARKLHLLRTLLVVGFVGVHGLHAPAQEASASQRAAALYDEYWSRTARMYPEWATYRGDHRFADRLNDGSPEARERGVALAREMLARVQAIPREQLPGTERISAEVFARQMRDWIEIDGFTGYRSMTVDASPWPFQGAFGNLLRASPMDTEDQARAVLRRMAAYPARMDQEIAKLRAGQAEGWVPPRRVLQVVLRQLDEQLSKSGRASLYFESFGRLGTNIDEPARERLREQGAAAVDAQVLPAIRQLREFVANEYMASAPEEGGLSRYPGGLHVYEALVRRETTTDLSPQAIHAIGLREVAAAREGMEAVRREVGFVGDLAAFIRDLNTDRRFFKKSGDDVLAGYREIIARIEPQLPLLFANIPQAQLGVRATPDFLGIGAVESYNPPSLDGKRPAWFNANALAYAVRPAWGMEAIALHEGVPGHHLQYARAVELTGLPMFRRSGGFTAFGEGWALYAETLGPALGLYQDPYSRFGFYTNQAWRAARLVVDTGLHAKGWTRQQAIDYMTAATGMEANRVEWEVDRYLSQPGQALAYMIGQLKILELREKAQRALGARFDLRGFHAAVLDEGQVPLDVLEQIVDRWVATR